jgi:hypothetical protein
MARPKLHHHVPQYYQSGFCKDGRLWVFDRVTGRYRQDQPKNVGAKTHDYSITTENGTKDPKLEEFLSEIEGAAIPIFGKLRGGDQLTAEDKETFSYYLGFFFLRGPRFQRMLDEISTIFAKTLALHEFQSPDDVRKAFDELPDLTDEQRANLNAEALYQFARAGNYTVRLNREYGLKLMVEQAIEMQNYFRQMEWMIGHCDRTTAFLTTDNPLVVVPPLDDRRGAPGVITPGAAKIFPVAVDTCLVLLDRGEGVVHKRMSTDVVRRTNIEVVGRCERLVLGRDEAHVRNIVTKTRIDQVPADPLVEAGSTSG